MSISTIEYRVFIVTLVCHYPVFQCSVQLASHRNLWDMPTEIAKNWCNIYRIGPSFLDRSHFWVYSPQVFTMGKTLQFFDSFLTKILNWWLNHSTVAGIWKTKNSSVNCWLLLHVPAKLDRDRTSNNGEQHVSHFGSPVVRCMTTKMTDIIRSLKTVPFMMSLTVVPI